ncbi:MAG: cobyrinate a,c-diamide synthase [Hyphomicrobiales bacterium]
MAKGLVIAAPASRSGKTVVTLGILRALRNRGVRVASAKAGPDYIDPCFHEAATGRPCFNLDLWGMGRERVATYLDHLARDADLVIIEGVMGLFDGPESGAGSTADLAAELNLPVALIIDCASMGQSAGAMIRGFDQPEPAAAVILNRVAGARHERIVKDAIADPERIVGAIPRTGALALPSRHLGLVQASEHDELETFLEDAARIVSGSLDLEALLRKARPIPSIATPAAPFPRLGQRIAVARDRAFAFCYPHLLHDWTRQGSEIVPFSPLSDESPHGAADAIYFPGGYPELYAEQLSRNRGFIDGVRRAASAGALVYGECGGFMAIGDYLIDKEGVRHPMAGLLPAGTSFRDPKLQLGYRSFRHSSPLPFPASLRGHEFHYSRLDGNGDAEPLFEASDARGDRLGPMGAKRGRVMGSYAHII